ncbi:MAG: hypothetical protein QOD14_280 [Solirubrobacterales bacterium]|jgi:hypothetical protein|nr:hypothetical protein [Solirubrobacterales bacterium]
MTASPSNGLPLGYASAHPRIYYFFFFGGA